jgi:hypothetical protein
VTNIDEILRPWVSGRPEGWNEDVAEDLAQRLAAGHSLSINWEPGDEEWITLIGDDLRGMIHVRYPLAIAVGAMVELVRGERPEVKIVKVDDLDAEELSASPEVLRATVLPYTPWSEDFDPEHFSASDLFFESV